MLALVVSVISEWPYIRYNGDSKGTEDLAQ
jgi:hypothetical protein